MQNNRTTTTTTTTTGATATGTTTSIIPNSDNTGASNITENLHSNEIPSQLTITDLDPPLISNHHSLSTTQNQPTVNPRSPISSSLSRRLLAVSTSQRRNSNQINNLESEWRRRFFDQMDQDFQTGFNRSQAVSRLRQRMNQLRSSRRSSLTTNHPNQTDPQSLNPYPSFHLESSASPSPSTYQFGRNLVDILHQVRFQRDLLSRQVDSHHTYLLYCGSNSDQPPHESSNQDLNTEIHSFDNNSRNANSSSMNDTSRPAGNPVDYHRGCGKLITIRATLMTPKPAKGFIYGEVMGDSYNNLIRRSTSEYLLFTSDSDPLPDSVDIVDDHTQKSFETDRSNLFHRGSLNNLFCSCEKTYLGCLSCGNIVGHTVTTLCRKCQEHSRLYPHSYYINRLVAIPRYVNGPISLELHNVIVPPDQKIMSWTQALLRKKNDTEAGYIGNITDCRSGSISALTDSLGGDGPVRLSERVRNAIFLGSVDNLLDRSRHIQTDKPGAHYSSCFDMIVPTLIDSQTSTIPNYSQLSMSSLASFDHSIIRRSSGITLNSSSNRLLNSVSDNHRFERLGLTRRPAVRISNSSGIRSTTRSRPVVRLRSSAPPESWVAQEQTNLELNEIEDQMEVKEGVEGEEEIDNNRSGNSRRPRINDDDDDNDDRPEVVAFNFESDQEDLISGRLNQPNSFNNSNRASTRAVRRRIHRNLDSHFSSTSTYFDDHIRFLRFSYNFNWSGNVCGR